MKKRQLKSGMMVELDEKMCLVLLNTESEDKICNLSPTSVNGFVRHFDYFGLENFNEDLTSCNTATGDIVAVYSAYGEKLWEKPKVVEMTMQDIQEALGYEVKVVK